MITYEITSTGYRIYKDETLWFIQESEYSTVYPGETMEERAQNHIDSLGIIEDDNSVDEIDPNWNEAYDEVSEEVVTD